MLKKIITTVAIAVMASLGIVAVGATPALASGCGSNAGICFYANSGTAEPAFKMYSALEAAGHCLDVQDNITSEIWNTSQWRWYVYTTNNCTGTPGIIYPGSFGPMRGAWDNSIKATKKTTQTS